MNKVEKFYLRKIGIANRLPKEALKKVLITHCKHILGCVVKSKSQLFRTTLFHMCITIC